MDALTRDVTQLSNVTEIQRIEEIEPEEGRAKVEDDEERRRQDDGTGGRAARAAVRPIHGCLRGFCGLGEVKGQEIDPFLTDFLGQVELQLDKTITGQQFHSVLAHQNGTNMSHLTRNQLSSRNP